MQCACRSYVAAAAVTLVFLQIVAGTGEPATVYVGCFFYKHFGVVHGWFVAVSVMGFSVVMMIVLTG